MYGIHVALLSLLACFAAAAPAPDSGVDTTPPQIKSSGNTNFTQVTLPPAVHPDVDTNDLNHLKPKNSAHLHYDNNPDPLANSDVASVNISASEVPVVQLENIAHVVSVACTNNTATIVFNDNTAYRTAVQHWRNQTNLVMVSFSPTCGNGHAQNKREFILVKSITPSDNTLTINASMRLASVFDAFGTSTVFAAQVGRYTAPESATGKRGLNLVDTQIFKWDEYPTDGLQHGTWGSGFGIYNDSELSVACIGCGTKGSVAITGSFLWSWFGVKTAQMNVNGSMEAVAQIGIIAKGSHASVPVSPMQVAQVSLGAIEVPGFITLGPTISIHAKGNFDIDAVGSLLVGAHLEWPKIAGLGDLASRVATATGYLPNVEPVHELEGTVTASLEAHLPVSIGLTVNLVEGWWVKSTQMTDTPGLNVTGQISDVKSCKGWRHTGTMINQMEMDIIGGITPFPSWNGPLYNICEPLSGTNSTQTATSTPLAGPTTAPRAGKRTLPAHDSKRHAELHKKPLVKKDNQRQRRPRAPPFPLSAPCTTSATSTTSTTSTCTTSTTTSETPCTTTPVIRLA